MVSDSRLPPTYSIPRVPTLSPTVTNPKDDTNPHTKTFVTPSVESFQSTFNPTSLLPQPHLLASPAGITALYTPSAIAASLATTNGATPPPIPALSSLSLNTSTSTNAATATATPPRRILLLHGLGTPALSLLPLAHALISPSQSDSQPHLPSPPIEIALIDLPGHGLSSTPLQPHTPSLLQAQIHLALSYLNWSRNITLVGYSFGGATALSFATTHPWMVRDVVLLGPVGVMDLERGVMRMGRGLVGRIYGGGGDEEGGGDGKDGAGKEEEEEEEEEAQTRRELLAWLEGEDDTHQTGHMPNVPVDAGERVARGEVVAQALRRWEVEEHPGFEWSVLSMFREGGVVGREEAYRALAAMGEGKGVEGGRRVRTKVVLGGEDPVCEEGKVRGLGLEDVEVLEGEGHAFPRTRVEDVARIIGEFFAGEAREERNEGVKKEP